jgi:hypothetical protein
MEAMSRRPPGITSLPLQLHQASPGIEIWTGSQDSSLAGWVDWKAANVQGDFLLGDTLFGAAKCQVRVLRLRLVGQDGRFASISSGLATIDGGSTKELLGEGLILMDR